MVSVALAVCLPAFVTAQVVERTTTATTSTGTIELGGGRIGIPQGPAELRLELNAQGARLILPGPLGIGAEQPHAVGGVVQFRPLIVGDGGGGVVVATREVPVDAPKAVAKKVVVREFVNVNANIGGVNANAMIRQWTTQFRPILRVEYLFVRVVCDPTKEERIPIARAGLKALDEAAQQYMEWQNNRNRVVQGKLIERPAIPDARQFIQEALAKAVQENLSAGQAERYRAEIKGRAAEAKRVGVLNFVARFDQLLILSAEQRDKLRESLSSHWGEPWSQGAQAYQLSEQYFPMVPDTIVTPILNDEQKTVWNGTQKITYNSSGFMGMVMRDGPLDEAFSDEVALKEDRDPEPMPEIGDVPPTGGAEAKK